MGEHEYRSVCCIARVGNTMASHRPLKHPKGTRSGRGGGPIKEARSATTEAGGEAGGREEEQEQEKVSARCPSRMGILASSLRHRKRRSLCTKNHRSDWVQQPSRPSGKCIVHRALQIERRNCWLLCAVLCASVRPPGPRRARYMARYCTLYTALCSGERDL